MLRQFDEVLARGRLAAGEMDLQHADLGEFCQNLLPFLGRELAAGAVELDRVGAIGTLQRAAMRELREHRKRNAKGLRGGARFQRGQSVGARRLDVGGISAHGVFSRASVKKPLSARSCSMATTSVAMASRGAAYLATSRSTTSATRRWPSQSCSTSTAISSGASTRSGARITQTFRVSSNFSLACRGSTGRLVSLTLMLRLAIDLALRNECTRRNVALDIGVVERVELHPQHVGLEDQRIADGLALFLRLRVLLHELQRKPRVARRLGQAAAEIAHDVGVYEVVV